MPARRINACRIKIHRSYSVSDLVTCLKVHKNTVRNWQRDGLDAVDAGRPILFQGATVREFLLARMSARKRPCPPGTLYCLPCRRPRHPANRTVEYLAMTPTGGNLRATCNQCGRLMYRRAALADLGKVVPGCTIQISER